MPEMKSPLDFQQQILIQGPHPAEYLLSPRMYKVASKIKLQIEYSSQYYLLDFLNKKYFSYITSMSNKPRSILELHKIHLFFHFDPDRRLGLKMPTLELRGIAGCIVLC